MAEFHPVFSCKTKSNSTAQGKPRVYFTAHPDDFGRFFADIAEDILSRQNCAIYYAPENADSEEHYAFDISQMQLFLVSVTEKLLKSNCRTMRVDIPLAKLHHTPILPLMQESGLMDLFNTKFGNLQYLDKYDTDPTAISYDKKLTKFLNAVIVGDELAGQVRDAFDAYIFLSYRKKDRVYAQKLMKLIHRDPRCRDIAVWYDEFLVPGENFNKAIEAALKKSDLFALAVTPNLVNEKNYIMSVEYPKAVEHKKKILPVELLPTKRRKLKRKYKQIPDPINAEAPDSVHKQLLSQLNRLAMSVNDKPEHTFFIALAYLYGIDVEVDGKRGAALMEASANGGCTAAIEKMVGMYNYGEGVAVDYRRAIEWQEKLCDRLEEDYRKTPDEKAAHELLDNCYDWGIFARDQAMTDNAARAFGRLTDLGREFSAAYPDSSDICRDYAGGISMRGDVARLKGENEEAEAYYREGLSAFEKLQSHPSQPDVRMEISVCLGRLGELAAQRGDFGLSEEYFGKGLALCRQLERDDDAYSKERAGLFCQRMGVAAFHQDKLDEALDYFLEANKRHAALAGETNIGAVYGEVAYNLYYCGMIMSKKGMLDSAEDNLKKAVFIADSLSEQFYQLPKYRLFQCLFYCELAKVYEQAGNLDLADQCFEHSSDMALAYVGRMEASAPGNIPQVMGVLKEYEAYQKRRAKIMR